MNEQPTLLADLLGVLNEEDLIRLSYRLRRAGKYLASFALDAELALRETQKIQNLGTADSPVTH